MSEALYEFGGLRFWSQDEIELREMFQQRVVAVASRALLGLNPAWRIFRVEGPILTPEDRVSKSYTDKDVFVTNHEIGGSRIMLRPETTASSYEWARKIGGRLPLCIWQAGKSFRRELSDGATAAKLRFNEFWQLELQCIYAVGTKADYRKALIDSLITEVARFTGGAVRVVPSDRLPPYSESTLDIEVNGREVASCSIRTDYSEETRVCEIAFGLDRIVHFASKWGADGD
jgi:glycyl-tRNA synthetase